MKSYRVALCLLLFGGIFGLHHCYLGRNRHGIVNLFTLGGFLFGLLHDLLFLRYYVRWANFEKDFESEYLLKIQRNPQPELSYVRTTIMGLASQIFGALVHSAIPVEVLHPWIAKVLTMSLVPFSVAIAVWYIGSIGEIEGSLKWTLKGALWTAPVYLVYSSPLITAMTSLILFHCSCTYRTRPENPGSVLYKVLYVSTFMVFIAGLLSAAVSFNCTLEVKQGVTMKCDEALRHISNSAQWKAYMNSVKEVRDAWQEGDLEDVMISLSSMMDTTKEQTALHVLGLSHGASRDNIRKAYRNLSRKFHPDKLHFENETEMRKSLFRFIKIQNAYQTLSKAMQKTVKHQQKKPH